MRKLTMLIFVFPLLSAFFLFALTPALQAQNVDDKIQALENELTRLKGEQMELKKEATAATAELPSFTYRPGAGLSIRGADRSWELRARMRMNFQMGFFPQRDPRGNASAADEGPSQGLLHFRRIRPEFDYYWADRFYHMSLRMDFEGDPPDAGSAYFDVDFSRWSPYYPVLGMGRKSPVFNENYLPSTFNSTMVERPLVINSLIRTGRQMGIHLRWDDVPLPGFPGTIDEFGISYTMGREASAATAIDSTDPKALITGVTVSPMKTTKNYWLEGMSLGVGYYLDHAEKDVAGGRADRGSRRFRIQTTESFNQVDLFRLEHRGRWSIIMPNAGWNVGQYRFGFSYDMAKADREFSGLGGTGSLDEAEIRGIVLRNGLFVWGPKGFLSGNERRGVMVAYNFQRVDTDAGANFATRNSFSAFRHNRILSNAFLLRWIQAENMVWSLQWQWYNLAKMAGTGSTPRDARQRLGLRGREQGATQGGGDYQAITLGADWRF